MRLKELNDFPLRLPTLEDSSHDRLKIEWRTNVGLHVFNSATRGICQKPANLAQLDT